MANSKRKCAYCKERKPSETMFIKGTQAFCSKDHYIEYAVSNKKSLVKKGKNIIDKEKRKRHSQRKKELRPIKWWQDELQKVVNYYVVHIRDKDKPCCTCGNTNPDIKYDAGHYRTRGAAPEIRYELKNIHKQCSVRCNQYGSGMRAEYREFIVNEYGKEALEWLDGKHKSLKETFKGWEDYEKEIQRYKKLIKELE